MVADSLLLLQGGTFAVLLMAVSVWDIQKRIIPDTLCLCIALTGFMIPSPEKLFGILVAVPFLIATLIWGGMGGGDIKLMAAIGLALGFYKGMTAMVAGLVSLLLFHIIRGIIQKLRGRTVPKAYPLAPFLSLGCYIAYLITF
ncbi:A24 family peptidase [Anaerocolumna aminovalerica]|uniref:prepilin peptidase n=1 Tax=Anaerocolumna aminovalerica TaxID=1527 RepID=UPI000BE3A429|nr:A24 family peptidase [Anaerocolumna aminovalerica]